MNLYTGPKRWQEILPRFGLFFLFLLTSCSSLFYQPDSLLHFPPKNLGFSPTEFSFKSADGTKLVGWKFNSQNKNAIEPPSGTIVQFHGNAENLSSHYLSLAWLTRANYQLFTFDYRGYGGSEGDPSQKGVYEDGMAALREAWIFHQANSPKGKFIIIGQSLGGAVAMRCLEDFENKEKVSLVVIDSSFPSYKTVARKVLQKSVLTWLFSPLGSVLVSDEYSPEESYKKNKIPLLLIHDVKDPALPYVLSEEIAKLAKDSLVEFWSPEFGYHVGTFNPPDSPYRKKLVRFFQKE